MVQEKWTCSMSYHF